MRKLMSIMVVLFAFVLAGIPSYAALTPDATYTITIQKMNSDGTVSDYSTTTATADADGKLGFTLSSMPTNADCNFIVIIIKDANGNTVRRGFVPAPHSGSTNLMGANTLSTVQTNAILAAGTAIGTDDPIPIAYLLTLLRSEGITEAEALAFASLGKLVIVGSGGFEGFLTTNGVTAAQLTSLKSYLVYNPTAGKKTIADLTASFKTAVDSNNTTTAKQEMQKAGGFMADVFMDAAAAAGIDMGLILAAHDAAGDLCQSADGQAILAQISSNVQSSMNQSMTSFSQRIKAVKVKSEYTKALNTLNASGEQVTRFSSAVDTMMTAMAAVDSDYADYYNDPQSYLAAHSTNAAAVQQAMNDRYNTLFTNFQTAIQSTDADITTMKTNVASAFGINQSYLPSDFGKYYDFTGTQKNWPIPQTVMVNWMASILTAGGSFSCTSRDSTAIPSFATWMGSCSSQLYWDQASCQSHGGTWSQQRHDFSSMSPSPAFNAYMGLQEDVQIIETSRYALYQGGQQPTKAEEKAARLLFSQRLDTLSGLITGTTDGTTVISTAQKQAVVKLLMQPSMD
jgi:hypothetical protein